MPAFSEKHHNILQDFLRYCLYLFIPLVIAGVIYCLIYGFSFHALLFNPLIYSIGISLIIIVITHDINDLLDLVGLSNRPALSDHVTFAREVQHIGVLMSSADYQEALAAANKLISQAPRYTTGYNPRGEILMKGFHNHQEARKCFDKVLKLAGEDSDEFKLAKALKAATYK